MTNNNVATFTSTGKFFNYIQLSDKYLSNDNKLAFKNPGNRNFWIINDRLSPVFVSNEKRIINMFVKDLKECYFATCINCDKRYFYYLYFEHLRSENIVTDYLHDENIQLVLSYNAMMLFKITKKGILTIIHNNEEISFGANQEVGIYKITK